MRPRIQPMELEMLAGAGDAHSSRPRSQSLAANSRVVPIAFRPRGTEPPGPGQISAARTVPSVVPSDIHSSYPKPGLADSKNKVVPIGKNDRRVVDLRTVLLGADCGANYGSSDELAWSPDGRFIAVIAGRDVVVMQTDGKGARALPVGHTRSSWFGLTWQPIPPAIQPPAES